MHYPAVKLLVANRGEIAIRVLTAAKELGLDTVAIYVDERDRNHCQGHPSVKLAGPKSLLDPDAIIAAAKSAQATAIHPGYGFLSESAELAQKCYDANILFVGPSPACISAVGNKVSARHLAVKAKIPVIPGTHEPVNDVSDVYAFAQQYGYPLMIKATDGGGGRGIRMVHGSDQVESAVKRCMAESPSKQIFIEKAIVNAKHIEVQILGDRHGNLVHLFERDCSFQRRYQKILEICPAISLTEDLRSQIHAAAIRLSSTIGYDSAGTVEFLVQADSQEFYFLEVNPRIQVEHTITEQVTNIDIVQSQIRVALGESLNDLGLTQNKIESPKSVAIQARVVAEDPFKNNALSIGKIHSVTLPQGHGIRVDTWIDRGSVILPLFDSMAAKIIATASSLPAALAKLKLALQRTSIQGIETNLAFLEALVSDPAIPSSQLKQIHIGYLEDNMARLLEASTATEEYRTVSIPRETEDMSRTSWNRESSGGGGIHFKSGDAFNIEIQDPKTNDRQMHGFRIESISVNNFPDQLTARMETGSKALPSIFGLTLTRQSGLSNQLRRKVNKSVDAEIGAPVSGMLVEINARPGDVVKAGRELFVISAMKMETAIKAAYDGRVRTVHVKTNELVDIDDLIMEISKLSDSKM